MNISESKRDESSMYTIVGINVDGKTELFCNRNDEYVLSKGYSILFKGTYNEAENAIRCYINRNTFYCVIAANDDKLLLRKYVGVIKYAPINTLGIFRRRRDAKKFMSSINNKKAKETA